MADVKNSANKEKLTKLLELLIQRERGEEADRTAARERRELRAAALGFQQLCWNFNRVARCRHVKGSMTSFVKHYSVRMHTFTDGSQQIRCYYCPFEVWNKPEFSFKWAFGLKMVESSLNSPSASERIVPEFKGPEAGRGELRFKDLGGPIEEKMVKMGEKEGPIKGHQPSKMDWRPE